MKDVVMIVGGGVFQVPAITICKDMGYAALVIDLDEACPGVAYADFFEGVSTKDIPAAIACAKKYAKMYNLRGVFTAGTDVSYTVASIAATLGLPGIAPQAALRATNKYLMRCALADAGVPCPKFLHARSEQEAIVQAARLGYPLVIKPVDNMGARGVRRLENDEELREQFQKSIMYSGAYSDPSVIIEEYMEGPEISMDTLVDQNGDIHLLTIADRHIMLPPYFVEVGHSIPSRLPQDALDDAFRVMKQAIHAIGISQGAAKADIKITPQGAKIGEITARLSGGFHSQYTDPLATGMKSTKAAIDLALGNDICIEDITPQYNRVAIERAIIPSPGYITSITGLDEARACDGVHDVFLTLHEGAVVEPLQSNIGKVGHIIAYGQTFDEAENAYKKALSKICIKTESEFSDRL